MLQESAFDIIPAPLSIPGKQKQRRGYAFQENLPHVQWWRQWKVCL